LARDENGRATEAFTPDFHLPATDRWLEVTTLAPHLLGPKRRKLRRMAERYPGIDVRLVHQGDYLELLIRFGLDEPEQHHGFADGVQTVATDRRSLLGLGVFARPSGSAGRRLPAA
jgi:hypothetical protein